jgi:hypothetical protein
MRENDEFFVWFFIWFFVLLSHQWWGVFISEGWGQEWMWINGHESGNLEKLVYDILWWIFVGHGLIFGGDEVEGIEGSSVLEVKWWCVENENVLVYFLLLIFWFNEKWKKWVKGNRN